jgi:hypothetical protein
MSSSCYETLSAPNAFNDKEAYLDGHCSNQNQDVLRLLTTSAPKYTSGMFSHTLVRHVRLSPGRSGLFKTNGLYCISRTCIPYIEPNLERSPPEQIQFSTAPSLKHVIQPDLRAFDNISSPHDVYCIYLLFLADSRRWTVAKALADLAMLW